MAGDTGEGDPPPAGGGEQGQAVETTPVTEDQRWRKRAVDAEAEAGRLSELLARAQQDIGAAREAIDACERRREIDQALWEAGAADLETARLLTEVAISRMDGPDVRAAVADLAQTKPFLFGRAGAGAWAGGAGGARPAGALARAGASAASARLRDEPGAPDLAALAEEAALSGDRATLLRYLRLRRGGR